MKKTTSLASIARTVADRQSIVQIERYRQLEAAECKNLISNLTGIGHILTADGWCYVYLTR